MHIRAYNLNDTRGHRLAGYAHLPDDTTPELVLQHYWQRSDSRGTLLVVSHKPLSDGKRTFVRRKRVQA